MASISIDRTSQRFASAAQPEPDVVVEHTTEVMGWPDYSGGGEAPHATIWPLPGIGVKVREHIPWTQNAKALVNLPGGVETNRRGAIQFELIGTCDPKHKGDKGWYYWPDADDAVLAALADYQRPILTQFKIPFEAPPFQAYSASYGARGGTNTVRMSNAAWLAFQGICGHQHVPENVHGDPGAFPIDRFLTYIRQEDFLSALTDEQQRNLYARVMGGIPAGSAVGRVDAAGKPARLLDTGDGGYLLSKIQSVAADPAEIAAAIPKEIAAQVAAELAKRLSAPEVQ